MATSLPFVDIPTNTWIDLYVATGITVGTKIIIQNTGTNNIKLVEDSAEPDISTTGYNTITPKEFFTNADSNVGAWAYSSTDGRLQIEESA